MIPPRYTTATWLATKLKRGGKHATNVRLVEDGAGFPVQVTPGEVAVAVLETSNGRLLALTDRRLIEHGTTLFEYRDVVECHWMSKDYSTETASLSPSEQRVFKTEHHDRLFLRLSDGREILLEHLAQAVYPLLGFIQSIIPAPR